MQDTQSQGPMAHVTINSSAQDHCELCEFAQNERSTATSASVEHPFKGEGAGNDSVRRDLRREQAKAPRRRYIREQANPNGSERAPPEV